VTDAFDEARGAGILVPVPDRPPRVVVCTVHTTNYQDLADITVPTMQRYCEKHGYDFAYVPDWELRFPDLANEGDRFKARMFENLYAENKIHNKWDVFLWIDSDALIWNSDISVDALFTRLSREQGLSDNHHFLWGYDVGGPNSGVYFARFTWQAAAFMRTQLARSVEMGFGDNTAMINVGVVPPYNEWCKVVPGWYFNAYLPEIYGWTEFAEMNGLREDSLCAHLPGMTNEQRLPIARRLAEKAR
jgi:hypothetical protein